MSKQNTACDLEHNKTDELSTYDILTYHFMLTYILCYVPYDSLLNKKNYSNYLFIFGGVFWLQGKPHFYVNPLIVSIVTTNSQKLVECIMDAIHKKDFIQ